MPGHTAPAISLFLRLHGWVWCMVIVFGVVSALAAAHFERKATLPAQEGVTAQAEVVATRSRRTGSGDTHKYYVVVRYHAQSTTYEPTIPVSRRVMRDAAGHESIPIRYWREDPSVIEIESVQTVSRLWWSRGIALVALILGGAGAWVTGRPVAQLLWLNRHGIRTRAPVRRVHDTRVKINRSAQHRLIWQEPDGREARSTMHDARLLLKHPAGSEIGILRDPSGRIRSGRPSACRVQSSSRPAANASALANNASRRALNA